MLPRRAQRSLVLAVLVAMAVPVVAAPPESKTNPACQSLEGQRFVLRHPPLPPASETSPAPARVACPAAAVTKAILDGKAVELENVVLKDVLDLDAASEIVMEADLFDRNDQRLRLGRWLEKRRREHRAPNLFPGESRFRVIKVPISIRQSRIESIAGGTGDPLFFKESVDLRGTEIKGSLSLPKAIFREPVWLEDVKISEWVGLAAAHFDAGLDLTRARIAGAVRFDDATFGIREISRPRRERQLAETPALFTAATFGEAVSFRGAVFQSRADYQRATFGKAANFTGTRFRYRADFGYARFIGPLDAAHAIFEKDARFPGARFDGVASFRRAQFRWRADFTFATFRDSESTFREAQFGPSLSRMLTMSSARPLTWPRLFVGDEQTGYDFRNTKFNDRLRALAKSQFDVHQIFALATVLSAIVGLLVSFALRRRPLLRWWPEGGIGAVARVKDASPSKVIAALKRVLATLRQYMAQLVDQAPTNVKASVKGSVARTRAVTSAVTRPLIAVRASPREQLSDAAFMMATYAVLAVGLAVHYQSHTGSAVDLWVGLAYPVMGLVAWLGTLFAARVVIGFRARRVRAPERPDKPGPPWLDYFESKYHVARRSDQFVGAFVGRIPTGILGLAGLPGVGRSWLARAVLEGRVCPPQSGGTSMVSLAQPAQPIVAVRASNPPSADLLPFFSTLFTRVALRAREQLRRSLFTVEGECRHVKAAEELIESPRPVTLLPLGVVLASMAAIFALPWRPPHGNEVLDWSLATVLRVLADLTPLLLLVSIVMFAGAYYIRLWNRRNLRKALDTSSAGRLYMATERVLERLAYEESTSDELGGSVSIQGVGLQRRRSRALRERPITLAALLAEFESYVADLRVVYTGGVVVHIDDTDRIDDLGNVRELLLRLKATLVGGVLYLVPLPESVAEGRRLRTTGTAGTIAGLLDDLVVVEPMTTLEGLRMLARRGFFPASPAPPSGSVSDPVRLIGRDGLGLAICLLSGGIAKEILRLLRRVSTEDNDWTVDRLVERAWQDARSGVADIVRRSDLVPALRQPILLGLVSLTSESDDDAAWAQWHAQVKVAARSARPSGKRPRAEILDALTCLADRRHAITELRLHIANLATREQQLVGSKNLPTEEPWDDPLELKAVSDLENVRRAFLAAAASAGGTT